MCVREGTRYSCKHTSLFSTKPCEKTTDGGKTCGAIKEEWKETGRPCLGCAKAEARKAVEERSKIL